MILVLSNGFYHKSSDGYIFNINDDIEYTTVKTYRDASIKIRDYIEYYSLGSSIFSGGQLFDDNTHEYIGYVSYNGRVWSPNGNEIDISKINGN